MKCKLCGEEFKEEDIIDKMRGLCFGCWNELNFVPFSDLMKYKKNKRKKK